MRLRLLTDDDLEQSWALSRLAFGGERDQTPLQHEPPVGVTRSAYGAFDDAGRLVAKVAARHDHQWWGGRVVPMLGVAGVATHPDARGQGLVGRLLDLMVADSSAPLSVLFATAPGIYRRLGWEVVGTLDVTAVPTRDLPAAASSATVRGLTPADHAAVAALYDARGAGGNGLLARAPERTVATLLRQDVATVAVEDGQVTGYVGYQRERGYHGDGELHLQELIASTPAAVGALLGSLRSWDAVAGSVHWRGRVEDLAVAVPGLLPVPSERQPWSLRVLDPVAAVAARGFGPGAWTEDLTVAGVGHRLEVADGRGQLVPGPGGPNVTPRGLAALYAGAGSAFLVRHGLVDRPVPGLAAAFAGEPAEILDYF